MGCTPSSQQKSSGGSPTAEKSPSSLYDPGKYEHGAKKVNVKPKHAKHPDPTGSSYRKQDNPKVGRNNKNDPLVDVQFKGKKHKKDGGKGKKRPKDLVGRESTDGDSRASPSTTTGTMEFNTTSYLPTSEFE